MELRKNIKVFTVVHFFNENTADVVPATWILEDESQCYFPPKATLGLAKLQATAGAPYNPAWKLYSIRVIKSYGKGFLYIIFKRCSFHIKIINRL